MKKEIYRIVIDNWTYFPEHGRFVNKEEEEFFIEARLNRILKILILHKNAIVKRDDIIDYVWREVQVNEENLTKGIFDLRKTLKEKGINSLEIKTIRAVGYRLEIKENALTSVSPKTALSTKLLKASIYLIGGILLLIMFIRAINYDNC